MLVMVNGKVDFIDNFTQSIQLNIPVIYLDDYDYKISVRMINLESHEDIKPQFFSLLSTVVDKNALNPKQELYNFRSNGSNYIYIEPILPREYKIQLKDIHTAEFKLLSTEEIDFHIKDFKILLNISRDVRIQ